MRPSLLPPVEANVIGRSSRESATNVRCKRPFGSTIRIPFSRVWIVSDPQSCALTRLDVAVNHPRINQHFFDLRNRDIRPVEDDRDRPVSVRVGYHERILARPHVVERVKIIVVGRVMLMIAQSKELWTPLRVLLQALVCSEVSPGLPSSAQWPATRLARCRQALRATNSIAVKMLGRSSSQVQLAFGELNPKAPAQYTIQQFATLYRLTNWAPDIVGDQDALL